MEAHLRDVADLVLRWVHMIAGIMWIGNSLLFNWLDRNLEKEKNASDLHVGRIFMVHSGGFYDVEKKLLPPGQLPDTLHWFKWQNFSTWASGILLLIVVYYLGGGAYLVDPTVAKIGVGAAAGIGLGSIVIAWVVYDLTWRLLGKSLPVLAAAISFLLLGGLAFGLSQVLSGRAAYIHVGVIIGTIMTANVWMIVLPSQRELVAATKEGREQDPKIGDRAKQRSIHNNYLTFPLLFIMISNHFPATYGSKLGWLILIVLGLGGALVRHMMNIRFTFGAWLPVAGGVVTVTLIALFVLTMPEKRQTSIASTGEPVSFHTVQSVVKQRCLQCHSEHPTDDQWKVAPANIMFDKPEQLKAMAPRIKERAVVSKTMPLQNKTGMTASERDLLGDWVDQGAPIQ